MKWSVRIQIGAPAAALAFALLAFAGWVSAVDAATGSTSVTLSGAPPLATIPCVIDVIAGQTYTDFDLNDCVAGGQGARRFGPAPAPGANPEIDPGGSYVYVAPDLAGATSFPFTVTDQANPAIDGVVTVIVHAATPSEPPSKPVDGTATRGVKALPKTGVGPSGGDSFAAVPCLLALGLGFSVAARTVTNRRG